MPRVHGYIRELKHRRFWAANGNQKLNFPPLERFNAIAFVTWTTEIKTKAYPARGKEQNHTKKKTLDFRLPPVAQKRRCLRSLLPPFNFTDDVTLIVRHAFAPTLPLAWIYSVPDKRGSQGKNPRKLASWPDKVDGELKEIWREPHLLNPQNSSLTLWLKSYLEHWIWWWETGKGEGRGGEGRVTIHSIRIFPP